MQQRSRRLSKLSLFAFYLRDAVTVRRSNLLRRRERETIKTRFGLITKKHKNRRDSCTYYLFGLFLVVFDKILFF